MAVDARARGQGRGLELQVSGDFYCRQEIALFGGNYKIFRYEGNHNAGGTILHSNRYPNDATKF
jgi:hypothetical protein